MMTSRVAKKFHRAQTWIAWVAGGLAGLLVARLVARLLAARPDSPAIELLYALSWPLVAPLALIDRDQPRFGAVLELGTLATLLLLLALAGLGWAWAGRIRGRPEPQGGARPWQR